MLIVAAFILHIIAAPVLTLANEWISNANEHEPDHVTRARN